MHIEIDIIVLSVGISVYYSLYSSSDTDMCVLHTPFLLLLKTSGDKVANNFHYFSTEKVDALSSICWEACCRDPKSTYPHVLITLPH